MLLVKIDNRERCKSILKNELENVVFENLQIGDIEFSKDGQVLLVVERKTIDDFSASIIDGRYREQKARLLATHPPSSILYIVEGNILFDNKVFSAIVSTCLRDKIGVINLSNSSETIQFIKSAYAKLSSDDFTKKLDYTQVLAESTISTSKKSNMDIKTFFIAVLSCVPGISSSKALQLYEIFGTISNMIKTITLEQNPIEYIKNLKVGNKKLGKTGENIITYFGIQDIHSTSCKVE